MPRVDDRRSVDLPYVPAPPPTPTGSVWDVVRYVWEEFGRVSLALIGLDQPNSMSLAENETLTPGPTATFVKLFDNGTTPQWINPSTAFDPATGTYTIPQDGVWRIEAALRIPAFAAPGNRLYFGSLRVDITPPVGVATQYLFYDGGDDTIPLTVTATLQLPQLRGATVEIYGAVVHPTVTDPQTVEGAFTTMRESGIGNPVR
jgi:hypothetical protein